MTSGGRGLSSLRDHHSREVIGQLMNELTRRGYSTRIDAKWNHPRLYVGAGEGDEFRERYVNVTAHEHVTLEIKRRDVERELLPQLPQPQPRRILPVLTDVTANGQVMDVKVHDASIAKMGKGGTVIITLPREACKVHERATALLTSDGRLQLLLGKSGTPQSSTRGEHRISFIFKATDFPITDLKSGKLPRMVVRQRGQSLIFDQALPREEPADLDIVEDAVINPDFSLERGSAIIKELNDWLRHHQGDNDTSLIVNVTKEMQIVVEMERIVVERKKL